MPSRKSRRRTPAAARPAAPRPRAVPPAAPPAVPPAVPPAQASVRPARPDTVPGQVRTAAAIVGLEALALLVAALILLLKSITGHPGSLARALLDAAFALLGVLVLAWGARGLTMLRASARTPVVVLQLLTLPVGYSLGFQAGLMGYAAPMLVAALVVLYLLFTPPARAALDRPPPGD